MKFEKIKTSRKFSPEQMRIIDECIAENFPEKEIEAIANPKFSESEMREAKELLSSYREKNESLPTGTFAYVIPHMDFFCGYVVIPDKEEQNLINEEKLNVFGAVTFDKTIKWNRILHNVASRTWDVYPTEDKTLSEILPGTEKEVRIIGFDTNHPQDFEDEQIEWDLNTTKKETLKMKKQIDQNILDKMLGLVVKNILKERREKEKLKTHIIPDIPLSDKELNFIKDNFTEKFGKITFDVTKDGLSRIKENTHAPEVDFTLDFNLGYRTRKNVTTQKEAGDSFISIDLIQDKDKKIDLSSKAINLMIEDLFNQLPDEYIKGEPFGINVTGNEIKAFKNIDYKFKQETLNELMYKFGKELKDKGINISNIRSGGQSGIEEAGAVMGRCLNIPTIVNAIPTSSYCIFQRVNDDRKVVHKDYLLSVLQERFYDNVCEKTINAVKKTQSIQDMMKASSVNKNISDKKTTKKVVKNQIKR